MKVGVIGSKSILSKINDFFKKQLGEDYIFIDVDKVELVVGQGNYGVYYKNNNLKELKYLLFLAEGPKKEFYYTIARMLENKVKLSITTKTLAFFWNEPIKYYVLSKHGINIVPAIYTAHAESVQELPEFLSFPLNIKKGSNNILVNDFDNFKEVVSLFKAGHTYGILKDIEFEEKIYVFKTMKEILAYSIGKETKIYRVDKNIAEIVEKIYKIFESDFLFIEILKTANKYYVSKVSLIPDFEAFNKIYGRNIANVMAAEIKLFLKDTDVGKKFLDKIKEIFSLKGGNK